MQRYHAAYNAWPTEWPIVSYSAFQAWVAGVNLAKSFDGTKVADALSGATVDTLRGSVTFRTCDHQGMIPLYIGKVAETVDPTYGFPLVVDWTRISANDMAMPCDRAVALQKK